MLIRETCNSTHCTITYPTALYRIQQQCSKSKVLYSKHNTVHTVLYHTILYSIIQQHSTQLVAQKQPVSEALITYQAIQVLLQYCTSSTVTALIHKPTALSSQISSKNANKGFRDIQHVKSKCRVLFKRPAIPQKTHHCISTAKQMANENNSCH